MTPLYPTTEQDRWSSNLRDAWSALTTVEQGCLIRQRMIWRGWPPHRYQDGYKPPLARPGETYKVAHDALWLLEVAYRSSSKCRGAQAEG